MTDELAVVIVPKSNMATVAVVADRVSAKHAFDGYRLIRAQNTLVRQEADLRSFGEYLRSVGVTLPPDPPPGTPPDLALYGEAWSGISAGLVAGFVKWMTYKGYTIGTINARLSTIKTYVGLAKDSQAVSVDVANNIRQVKGFSITEGTRIDARREKTRTSEKKAEAVALTVSQVNQLRRQPKTPIGRRDALIVNLLADQGLRCGEAASIKVDKIDLIQCRMIFYREKVGITQTHDLTKRVVDSLHLYLSVPGAPTAGPLLRAVTRDGKKLSLPLKNHGIAKRIRAMGLKIGIPNLSPHDLRHYWATQAARHKTPIDRLIQAGGWRSPAMPMRYIEKEKIANEGVILDESTEQK